MPENGGCDVTRPSELVSGDTVRWTARALPSVLVVTDMLSDLTNPRFQLAYPALDSARVSGEPDRILCQRGYSFRIHLHGNGGPPAVLLPLDRLFDVRAAAAQRLWRMLASRNPGPNPAALSAQKRNRLVQALRALDGRLSGASYRELAVALFALEEMTDAAWQTEARRGQVIRLTQLGTSLMTGGYRDLLLYPYRQRL